MLIVGGLNKRGASAFQVEITNTGWGCNSLKWLEFPKIHFIGECVVIVGGTLKLEN